MSFKSPLQTSTCRRSTPDTAYHSPDNEAPLASNGRRLGQNLKKDGRKFKTAAHFSSVMLTVYLASTNPGKLREFKQAAESRRIKVELLPGIENLPVCIEDGNTFEENARKKAAYYSQWTDSPVFADDSGLCVDALGSAPGVYSARYAGPEADDEANNRKLLSNLAAMPQSKRSAHYDCVIALARRGKILTVVEGKAEGFIQNEPKGTGGFGYDPYFFFPPLNRTFAELSMEEKYAVSHRGEAFRKLLDYLRSQSEGV